MFYKVSPLIGCCICFTPTTKGENCRKQEKKRLQKNRGQILTELTTLPNGVLILIDSLFNL